METEPPLGFCLEGLLFIQTGVSLFIPLGVLFLILLLVCSALVSGSELAYLTLTPKDLESLRSEQTPAANRMLRLRASSRRLLMTLLILKNLLRIGVVIVSVLLMHRILPANVLGSWAGSLRQVPGLSSLSEAELTHTMFFLFVVVIVTFLLVLFGEVAPKVYAKLNQIRLARFMSRPLSVMVGVLSPFSSILAKWSLTIERRWQDRINGSSADASIKEDIDRAIDLTMPQDASSQMEAGILKSIIKLNDVPVKQIMHSRVDMVAIDAGMTFSKLKDIVRTQGYSRLPVYRENLDSILGILYVKDLIGYMEQGDDFHWQELVRQNVLYIPEAKKINEVLKNFQREHNHMGIVVDEYGGTAGVVTLEDVMEEVIGEIKDEFDDAAEGEYRKIDAHTFLFDGKVLINDMCRIVGMDNSAFEDMRGDADSLAGLILEISGRMPSRGEEFDAGGMAFTVISVSARRIEKIRVRIPQQS